MSGSTRRNFLRTSVTAAGLPAVGTLVPSINPLATEANANDRRSAKPRSLTIAVLGAGEHQAAFIRGLAGRHHCALTAICAERAGQSTKLLRSAEKAQGRAISLVSNPNALLTDPTIDVVAISTPKIALQESWVRTALEAGKDLLLDLSVSSQGMGQQLLSWVEQSGRICAPYLPWRSAVGLRQAMQFVYSGRLGDMQELRALALGPKKGERLVFPLDLALWATSEKAEKSEETSFSLSDLQVQSAQLFKGRLHSSQRSLWIDVRPEGAAVHGVTFGTIVTGSRGVLALCGPDSAVAFGPDGAILRVFQGGGDFFAGFARAIRTRDSQQLSVDLQEGIRTSEACFVVSQAQTQRRASQGTPKVVRTQALRKPRSHSQA